MSAEDGGGAMAGAADDARVGALARRLERAFAGANKDRFAKLFREPESLCVPSLQARGPAACA